MYKTIVLLLAISCASFADSNCEQIWDKLGELNNFYAEIQDKCGADLKKSLKNLVDDHHALGYDGAREEIFEKLDNEDGRVCSVYSSRCVDTWTIPDHTVMNCEHTWPQSLGAVGDAKSDLHHLFPVMSRMNSRRGNRPFCEVVEATYDEWGSLLGKSENGTLCFEPPDDHKGDLARAMLYFAIRYSKSIDSEQEEFFRLWNMQDPVSWKEIVRNNSIFELQHNRNPFIDFSILVQLVDDF